jgi:hypothetical protein
MNLGNKEQGPCQSGLLEENRIISAGYWETSAFETFRPLPFWKLDFPKQKTVCWFTESGARDG